MMCAVWRSFPPAARIPTRKQTREKQVTSTEELVLVQTTLRMTEISLDSQKDVQFLKSNISLATREKLDTHLPPTAVPNIHSDSLRKRVEEMLDEVQTPRQLI